jgi:hypothetical protein
MGYLIAPPLLTDNTYFTIYFDEPLWTDNAVGCNRAAYDTSGTEQVASAFTETPAILTGFQSSFFSFFQFFQANFVTVPQTG